MTGRVTTRWRRALGLIVLVACGIRVVYIYVHGGDMATFGIDAGCLPQRRQPARLRRSHRRAPRADRPRDRRRAPGLLAAVIAAVSRSFWLDDAFLMSKPLLLASLPSSCSLPIGFSGSR